MNILAGRPGLTLSEGWAERVGEPNEWAGEHAGLRVLLRRSHMGSWCGYVLLPPGHRWGSRTPSYHDAQVHGGVTWCDPLKEGDPVAIGFDCGHAQDFCPGMHFLEDGVDPAATGARLMALGEWGTYRTIDYAMAEVRSLAEQAARAR